MKRKNIIIAILSCAISFNTMLSQESFKTMFYNILNFPTQSTPANRIDNLQIILSDYNPDLFMVCELNNESGANSILAMIQNTINPNYAMASFELNTSDDDTGNQNNLQNLIGCNGNLTLNPDGFCTKYHFTMPSKSISLLL